MTEEKSGKRQRTAKKIIIDTDPGVDDTMAILLAFNSPEVEVIGLTTIFGNVRTPTATRNAIHLCELAGKTHIPVAQGADRQLRGNVKERIATFVHGDDGLGNTGEPFPMGKAVAEDAADFLAHHCRDAPGEITIVALGPLTNLALAMQRDPDFPKNAAEIVVLGGALFCNGNVNPAAEANIFGDPDAADLVFTSGGLVTLIGLDVTQKTVMMAAEVDELKAKGGKLAEYCHAVSQFYMAYHTKSYKLHGMYLHDPAAILVAVDPTLFTYRYGAIRVVTDGITKGQTVMDHGDKAWVGENEWSKHPKVKVCLDVDSERLLHLIKERLAAA